VQGETPVPPRIFGKEYGAACNGQVYCAFLLVSVHFLVFATCGNPNRVIHTAAGAVLLFAKIGINPGKNAIRLFHTIPIFFLPLAKVSGSLFNFTFLIYVRTGSN